MTEPTNAADRRRGPRGGSSDTRAGIRLAARAEFAERGYAGATIRSIAARAEVDPALIHHYFGTKAKLFREVLDLGFDPLRSVLPAMLDGPREQAGERITRTYVQLFDDPRVREPLLAIMRTATVDPEAAATAAAAITEVLLPRLATLAVGPDPRRQVVLAMTHLAGTMLGRYVLGLAPLQCPAEDLVAELAPVVQRYLDGTYR